jgi:hypothetical protein
VYCGCNYSSWALSAMPNRTSDGAEEEVYWPSSSTRGRSDPALRATVTTTTLLARHNLVIIAYGTYNLNQRSS